MFRLSNKIKHYKIYIILRFILLRESISALDCSQPTYSKKCSRAGLQTTLKRRMLFLSSYTTHIQASMSLRMLLDLQPLLARRLGIGIRLLQLHQS